MNEPVISESVASETVHEFVHIPVLYREVIEQLQVKSGGLYLDLTLGGGGHSRLILEANPDVKVIGIDQDAMAIGAATANLEEFGDRSVKPGEGLC